jgi:rod shape-determining protein MreD
MSYSDSRILLNSQREGKVSRFRVWVLMAVPLAAVLFQMYVPLLFPFLSFLDMPLLVVVYFALVQRSQVGGLFLGAVIGLAQDSLSKNHLGMFGIANTMVGYFAASMGMRIDVDRGAIRLVITFALYLFHHFLYWAIARALLNRMIDFDIQKTLILGLLNAVVGVPLLIFLDKLRERS